MSSNPAPGWVSAAAWWAGLLLQLAVGWLYWVTPLVAPWWVVLALFPVWLLLLWLLIRWRRRRPWLSFLLPGAALALWWAVLTLGDAYLGWTA